MYSQEERTRLTGEINYMSAFIPGAERYFRRSLHVKNCRDRLIISSGFQEKGGCPLIRACSVITSNTVFGHCHISCHSCLDIVIVSQIVCTKKYCQQIG